ncbi:MAG: phosphate acyltransferase PlsX [Armatimonadetes bacterium]|nr:phosphate acyltransferase PlsX [Armatimonadota bacterium]
MRIAIDAMGGDYAPEAVVQGTLDAAGVIEAELALVGDLAKIEACLPKRDRPESLEIHHASQVVEMDDSPVVAVRQKKDSSLVVAAQMVKSGQADALVTVGNTGAAGAVSRLMWGAIPNIDRPAIATVIPTYRGSTVLIDSGASVDCSAKHLLDFALMGQIYASQVIGIENPRVALLNIGEEETKGNTLTKEAFTLMKSYMGDDFYGNVEGKHLFEGLVDVVVCDGFVGNVLLKSGEGVAEMMMRLLKEELTAHPLMKAPLALLRPAFKRFRARLDWREYGGAPLLGVKGVCIIGHGRSDAYAVRQAIMVAAQAVAGQLVPTIHQSVQLLHQTEAKRA